MAEASTRDMALSISLGFGIVFATSIILVILPCLYMALEDVRGLARQHR